MQIEAVVREAEGEPKGSMVLLHGLGSNAEDMFGLACELDPSFEIVCLQAPFAYGPGFAWFEIEWSEEGATIDEKQYWAAVEMVAEILPQIGERPIVGGFSQGAMITTGLLTRFPDSLQEAIILSGRSVADAPTDFKGRVFQAHGLLDEVIPFSDGEALRRSLTVLGDRLEFHGYPMPHTVSEEEIKDLNAWLEARNLITAP